ncbi:hypothetical protein PIB30_044101 [Stylosanthes scabra]|uniref:Uncharacterized protein n=1 Tax=Stylosanthes scabra TaxID=79078 RepID=A0ABU6ZEG3_9FABA|nr:hypothetical protein [Stylosanthes scabra]
MKRKRERKKTVAPATRIFPAVAVAVFDKKRERTSHLRNPPPLKQPPPSSFVVFVFFTASPPPELCTAEPSLRLCATPSRQWPFGNDIVTIKSTAAVTTVTVLRCCCNLVTKKGAVVAAVSCGFNSGVSKLRIRELYVAAKAIRIGVMAAAVVPD